MGTNVSKLNQSQLTQFIPTSIQNNSLLSLFKVGVFVASISGLGIYICKTKAKISRKESQVIVITGCDTGLGFSFAQHACSLGFIVIAGFLNIDSDGAKHLQNICDKKLFFPISLDVTNDTQIKEFKQYLEDFFFKNKNAELHAVINNAGIMIFGEFDWQTERLMQEQININFFGTLRVTRICMPFLRKFKGRIIVVGSHCASVCLPGLATYGATKAALHSWCDGLRTEVAKYGIKVIKFVPGSYIMQTNIIARLPRDRAEIENNLTDEQRAFYRDFIDRYFTFLSLIPVPKSTNKIDDSALYKKFENALTDKYPKSLYKHEPFNYKFNHLLFKISPICIRDYLVLRFVKMPVWPPLTS